MILQRRRGLDTREQVHNSRKTRAGVWPRLVTKPDDSRSSDRPAATFHAGDWGANGIARSLTPAPVRNAATSSTDRHMAHDAGWSALSTRR